MTLDAQGVEVEPEGPDEWRVSVGDAEAAGPGDDSTAGPAAESTTWHSDVQTEDDDVLATLWDGTGATSARPTTSWGNDEVGATSWGDGRSGSGWGDDGSGTGTGDLGQIEDETASRDVGGGDSRRPSPGDDGAARGPSSGTGAGPAWGDGPAPDTLPHRPDPDDDLAFRATTGPARAADAPGTAAAVGDADDEVFTFDVGADRRRAVVEVLADGAREELDAVAAADALAALEDVTTARLAPHASPHAEPRHEGPTGSAGAAASPRRTAELDEHLAWALEKAEEQPVAGGQAPPVAAAADEQAPPVDAVAPDRGAPVGSTAGEQAPPADPGAPDRPPPAASTTERVGDDERERTDDPVGEVADPGRTTSEPVGPTTDDARASVWDHDTDRTDPWASLDVEDETDGGEPDHTDERLSWGVDDEDPGAQRYGTTWDGPGSADELTGTPGAASWDVDGTGSETGVDLADDDATAVADPWDGLADLADHGAVTATDDRGDDDVASGDGSAGAEDDLVHAIELLAHGDDEDEGDLAVTTRIDPSTDTGTTDDATADHTTDDEDDPWALATRDSGGGDPWALAGLDDDEDEDDEPLGLRSGWDHADDEDEGDLADGWGADDDLAVGGGTDDVGADPDEHEPSLAEQAGGRGDRGWLDAAELAAARADDGPDDHDVQGLDEDDLVFSFAVDDDGGDGRGAPRVTAASAASDREIRGPIGAFRGVDDLEALVNATADSVVDELLGKHAAGPDDATADGGDPEDELTAAEFAALLGDDGGGPDGSPGGGQHEPAAGPTGLEDLDGLDGLDDLDGLDELDWLEPDGTGDTPYGRRADDDDAPPPPPVTGRDRREPGPDDDLDGPGAPREVDLTNFSAGTERRRRRFGRG